MENHSDLIALFIDHFHLVAGLPQFDLDLDANVSSFLFNFCVCQKYCTLIDAINESKPRTCEKNMFKECDAMVSMMRNNCGLIEQIKTDEGCTLLLRIDRCIRESKDMEVLNG